MAKDILCSLYIMNPKNITRSMAGSVLRPFSGGMVHFKHLHQVKQALALEKEQIIEIQTPLPAEITELISPTPTTTAAFVEVPSVEEIEPAASSSQGYLSWEQVEAMGKKDLLAWAEETKPEGLKLPKNKNASHTKQLVHEYLSEKFPEFHVAVE